MRRLFLPSLVLLLLVGCGDETTKTKTVTQKPVVAKAKPKPTYSEPKFTSSGELYKKDYTLTKVEPTKIIKASGNVKDIFVDGEKLYSATDAGSVDIFDLKTYELIGKIEVPSFHDDIYNEDVVTKVYSIDKIDDKIILLSSYKGAKKRLFVYENSKLNEVKNLDPNLMIIKARFIDKNRVLLGLLSNELILYDIENNKQIYRTALSEASFSDMALSKDKKEVVVGCESGIIYLVDTQSGKLKSIIQGANRDKSYKVDIKNGLVLSAGQDSVGAIYNLSTNTFKTLKASFLIYAGALSPDGSRASYSFNENNELIVVDAKGNETKAYLLSGQKSTLNAIVFRDNNRLVSASDDEYIMLWELP